MFAILILNRYIIEKLFEIKLYIITEPVEIPDSIKNLNIKKNQGSLNLVISKTIALVFAVILLSSFQSNFVNAQESTDSNFAAKGKTAYSSHFPGIMIWTQVKGVDGTFVFHGLDDELVVVRTTLTQSDECEQGSLCYDGTVNNAKNSDAIQVGDTFKLTVDMVNNAEIVSFLSGFLENVDVKISLTKIKTKPISTTSETEEKKNNLTYL